jgi:hypothetical protein
MRRFPHLYEINALVFLRRISRKYGRILTLAAIPDEEWRELARQGIDLIWLMGVWQRSPSSRKKAQRDPILRWKYDQALAGWTENDVVGSPYAVYSYGLDPGLGAPEELARLRQNLNRQGLGLILDFVPNHLAVDHHWTLSHPDWFVQGRKVDVQAHPEWFFLVGKDIWLAHGRDPNYPPWTDTAQLNFWVTELRVALIDQLLRIAEVCDGVRCDMAMLAVNEVFGQVWGQVVTADQRPLMEFWVEAIRRVKKRHHDFLFLAEVYWGLEQKLQQLGFDFTCDKSLYDRLRYSPADKIRRHLMMEEHYQQRLVHFVENHDEERAIGALGRQRSLAAAAIIATIPGLCLFHDGQFEGKRIHLPIQLMREPEEDIDTEVQEFYRRLLAVCNAEVFHEGNWKLIEVTQDTENDATHNNLLAWLWNHGNQTRLVAINYSGGPARGQLKLLLPKVSPAVLRDEITGDTYGVDFKTYSAQGMHLDATPWSVRIFNINCGPSESSCF